MFFLSCTEAWLYQVKNFLMVLLTLVISWSPLEFQTIENSPRFGLFQTNDNGTGNKFTFVKIFMAMLKALHIWDFWWRAHSCQANFCHRKTLTSRTYPCFCYHTCICPEKAIIKFKLPVAWSLLIIKSSKRQRNFLSPLFCFYIILCFIWNYSLREKRPGKISKFRPFY